MNNFVVARNALIASALVMLFMLSLQPERISNAYLSLSDAVISRITQKDINAAEENQSDSESLKANLELVTVTFPKVEGLAIEEKENAALVTFNNTSLLVATAEKYEGDVSSQAVSLAKKLKENTNTSDIVIQPVLRGGNMYFEVSSSDQKVHYALMKVSNETLLTMVPAEKADSEIINKILAGISFD